HAGGARGAHRRAQGCATRHGRRRVAARGRDPRGPAAMTGFRLAGGGGPVIPNFGQPSACLKNNGWFCTDWMSKHWGDTLQPALVQHIQLTLIAVGIGFAIAFVLALIGFRWRIFDAPLGGFTDFLYAIPS